MMVAFMSIATLGMAVGCEKDDSEPISGDTNGSIVGNWTVDKVSMNGSSGNTGELQMFIDINADGTGVGIYQQNNIPFSWTKNGNTLTITPNGSQSPLEYTITLLTDTECNITGTVVPFTPITGNISLHMVKDADPPPPPPPDPPPPHYPHPHPDPNANPDPDPQPDNFPAATNWNYDYTTSAFSIEYNNAEVNARININMALSFDATGNTGTLNVTANPEAQMPYVGWMSIPGYGVEETASFTYTYDATTGTGMANGHLSGTASEEVPFSYNSTDNTIVITLPSDIWTVLAANIPEGVDIPLSDLPTNIVFTRVN